MEFRRVLFRSVSGARTRPGDLLGHHASAGPTAEPPDLRLEVEPACPEVQVTPPTPASVVGGTGLEPAWAAQLPAAMADLDDHATGCEPHTRYGRAGNLEHPVECDGDAHVFPSPGKLGWLGVAQPNRGTTPARL